MTSLVSRAIAAVRVWLGLNDPTENHLYPEHGWLLPPSGAPRLEPVLVPSPVPVYVAGRRR